MPELFSAILNPVSPNFQTWVEILGNSRVPLESPKPVKAEFHGDPRFADEKDVDCYLLNLKALTLSQRARLVGAVALKFGIRISEVEAEINRVGFPIRAADVIVSYDMRAFA